MSIVSSIPSGVLSALRSGLNPGVAARAEIAWDVALAAASTTTGGGPYSTANITPVDGKPIYVALNVAIGAGTPVDPTLTGNGLTYELVESQVNGVRWVGLYRALADASSAGAIEIASTDTMTSAIWIVFQPADDTVTTAGTNADGSIGEIDTSTAPAASTSINTTLASLEHANNHHLCVVATSVTTTTTPDADFTELASDSEASTAIRMSVLYAANQLSCDCTFLSALGLAVAVEIISGEA